MSLTFASHAAGAEPRPEAGTVDVGDGVRIHYLAAGAPDARPTLLLVPGWGSSSAIWRNSIAALSGRLRVVPIDPRSQGESTVTTADNSPEQRARDLRAVVRSLDLHEVVLVGWSQGVQDVAAYAVEFSGEDVVGYVLVDAPVASGPATFGNRPDELEQLLSRLSLYEAQPRAYLEGMMAAIIRSPAGRQRIPELVDIALRTPPDLGVSMLLMDFVARDRSAALSRFDRPTLIIAAEDSEELDAQRAMARRIRGARIEVVGDTGHAVFLDQPRRFVELVSSFVDSIAC